MRIASGDAAAAWLVSRGLGGIATLGDGAGSAWMTPPPGVEVEETRQIENQTGAVLMQRESWNEAVGDDAIHVEVTIFPGDRRVVAFWIFPRDRPGCAMFQWTLYDGDGALQSRFWRDDAAPRPLGLRSLPLGLYPDAVPWMAFLRVLDAPRKGATGVLNQQLTPDSYVGQDVTATEIERICVIAGEFSALRVTAQVDVTTILPGWPRAVLCMIKPVVPKNTIHFEAAPPHRLLKHEGVTFVGGPDVTTELVRFYTTRAERADWTMTAARAAIKTL